MTLATPHLPELSPADLRLTTRELRTALSVGELKLGLVRRPVVLVLGVYDWAHEGAEEHFSLFRLVPIKDWRRWYKEIPETFDQRRLRLRCVDPTHPHGLIVQTPTGRQYVIDETLTMRVRAPNPIGNPFYFPFKGQPTATGESARSGRFGRPDGGKNGETRPAGSERSECPEVGESGETSPTPLPEPASADDATSHDVEGFESLQQPAHQAVATGISPISGTPPPAAHQFKPGQSGNPAGRPRAGASLREWMNILSRQGLNEEQMRAIARDVNAPLLKRAAAERLPRMIEDGDLEPLLDGTIESKPAVEPVDSDLKTPVAATGAIESRDSGERVAERSPAAESFDSLTSGGVLCP